MDTSEFQTLRRNLRNLSDIKKFPYPRGTLFTILSQKKVDSVIRKYPRVAERLDELADYWKSRKRMPPWLNLTPVMRVRLLLKALGYSKSEVAKSLRNPEYVEDEVLREAIWRAIYVDYIYSPLAAKHQFARGKLGEEIIRRWLNRIDIDHKDEMDMRKESEKTPDFFLPEPIEINGKEINWIESKALFGDPKTHRFYSKKQYSRYRELFGDGIVVYWFGYVKGLDGVSDGSHFKSSLRNALLDMRVYTKGIGRHSQLEKIIKNLAISTVVDLRSDNDLEIEHAEYVRIPELEERENFEEYMKTKEFVEGMGKLIEVYSRGRMLIVCKEKNWKKCHRRHISWILRNLGFDVVHI
jgi:hypothetical protein